MDSQSTAAALRNAAATTFSIVIAMFHVAASAAKTAGKVAWRAARFTAHHLWRGTKFVARRAASALIGVVVGILAVAAVEALDKRVNGPDGDEDFRDVTFEQSDESDDYLVATEPPKEPAD